MLYEFTIDDRTSRGARKICMNVHDEYDMSRILENLKEHGYVTRDSRLFRPQISLDFKLDNSFTTDWEKMYDFWKLTKREFLETYSYITVIEYDCTCLLTICGILIDSECPNNYYI